MLMSMHATEPLESRAQGPTLGQTPISAETNAYIKLSSVSVVRPVLLNIYFM